MTLLAKRYAVALFTLAVDKGVVDAVADDLVRLHAELVDPAARRLLLSPDVTATERRRVLDALVAGCHDYVRNLVGVLQHRHRLDVLADLPAAFRELWMARRGEVEGTAESAHPLDAAELARLTELAGRLTGKRVVLTGAHRPELIGGVRLRLGNVLYDGSLRAALRQLETHLQQSAV